MGFRLVPNSMILDDLELRNRHNGSEISIRVRYRKGPGWTGLDTNNLFLLNCRRERQTNPNPNPNPGPLR